jgi:glycosyltransferase involved in cell wall biosynthesis
MLVILTTHPIQYQVPLWQQLAASGGVDFEVWYMSDHSARPSLDREFGRVFAWDIDLLSGYPHRFLDAPRRDITRFLGARLPNFGAALQAAGATALFVNGWQTAAYWDAVYAAHALGIPVWMRGESNDLARTPLWKRAAKRVALGRLFGRIDHFLTIGAANRRLYEAYGVRPTQLHPAPYSVDNERFADQAVELSSDRASLRRAWGVPEGSFCVLFAGKLIAKKRPHDIVSAARQLAGHVPSIHLLFVGDGELASSLKAACAGGVSASFTGFLNQREIAKAYAAADCLVLPSYSRETWGLVVNEAMAGGLPCVVSDQCGCAEDLVAPIDPSLVFRMGSADDLARAIRHVIDRAPSRDDITARIREFAFARAVDTIATLAEKPARERRTHRRVEQAGV